MPWRYILEIAGGMNRIGSHATVVSNGSSSETAFPALLPPVIMLQGPFRETNAQYRACIRDIAPDVIFLPISRRSALAGAKPFLKEIPHIAYFPSAWYAFERVLRIAAQLPPKDALVYLTESLCPGSSLVNLLRRNGIRAITTMTDYTAQRLVSCGWPQDKIRAFTPGLNSYCDSCTPSPLFDTWASRFAGRKYFLFLGPPKDIRGFYVLLQAFDRSARFLEDAVLVCLTRHDPESPWSRLRKAIDSLTCKERVILVDDILTEHDVASFIKGSYAVVLPFLLIPSEIPLAVIEALSMGKPVIISESGGTSQFVGTAGITVPPNDAAALSRAMITMYSDQSLYGEMCGKASDISAHLPTWEEQSKQFLQFTAEVLQGHTHH